MHKNLPNRNITFVSALIMQSIRCIRMIKYNRKLKNKIENKKLFCKFINSYCIYGRRLRTPL